MGHAADRDQDLRALDPAAVAERRRSTPAPPASIRSRLDAGADVDAEALAQRRRRLPRRRRAPRARAGGRCPRPGSPWSRARPRPGRARCRPGRRRARSCSPGPAWRWCPGGCSRRSTVSRPVDRRHRGAAAGGDDRPRCGRSAGRRRPRRGARRRSGPSPRKRSMPRSSSQGSWPESSRSWITSSRRSRIACGSSSPSPRRHAGDPPRLAQHVGGAQQRLRGHAGVVGAFAADQVPLDDRDLHAAVGEAAGADLARGPGARARSRRMPARSQAHHPRHRTIPSTEHGGDRLRRGRLVRKVAGRGCRRPR